VCDERPLRRKSAIRRAPQGLFPRIDA